MKRWLYSWASGPGWEPRFFMLAAAVMLAAGLVSIPRTQWGWAILAIAIVNLIVGSIWLRKARSSRPEA
jgi:hypothetical protein